MDKISVIGLQVDAATYETALEESLRLSRLKRSAAVSAANTHIAAMNRHDSRFCRIMGSFDMVLPDGMPLIWAMNRRLKRANKQRLDDRVYGPYFMKYVVENAPVETKHFLFGGSQKCLDELQNAMQKLRSDIKISGAVSPPYRAWMEDDQAGFAETINEANPDFIWVALGGEKQERWIIENMHRVNRGVFFAIGDAFELLAGRRPFAPDWCQRYGVTWLYRLLQEPRRMWKRYLKYNTLFIIYLMLDRVKFIFKRGA
jgi:N-acetylglucosaminyldiphosphoundecaprenol N-acetyl-beta-D-mannosaminyltransferase